jgi:methanogenic corrinoid protein MtbC1
VTTRSPMPDPEVSIREIVVACADYDPTRVRDELDLTLGATSLGGCVDDVLFPALRQIGSLWQTGQLDLEAERLTSEAIRGWLEVLALRAPEPYDAAPLLLACGPADQHSIGLEALDVLLRHQRQRCRVLGSRTSVRTLTTAMRANQPSAVVIASHLSANRASATQSLRAAAATGAEVYYAGNAFASVRLRRHVPGTHLNSTLQSACDLILEQQRRLATD